MDRFDRLNISTAWRFQISCFHTAAAITRVDSVVGNKENGDLRSATGAAALTDTVDDEISNTTV